MVRTNDPRLKTNQEHIQTSYSRYSLMDYLEYHFKWDYHLVVTFGFFPHKDEVDETLYASHYRFDRWLLTNNKLNTIPVDVRSRWVCIPEYGNEGHLHYNCFLKLGVRPHAEKTYMNEWDSMRQAFKGIFKALEKGKDGKQTRYNITYHLREKDRIGYQELQRLLVYDTKEIRQQYINDKGRDNFSNIIRSWIDWQIKPITKSSPKKISKLPQLPPKETVLTKYMS